MDMSYGLFFRDDLFIGVSKTMLTHEDISSSGIVLVLELRMASAGMFSETKQGKPLL
jgi:uncharacterized membrane protein